MSFKNYHNIDRALFTQEIDGSLNQINSTNLSSEEIVKVYNDLSG